ncbi:MAG: HIT family protein [bacterium]
MTDCVFCDRIHNDGAQLSFDGDHFVAFPDRFPVNSGHTLVVPRNHVSRLRNCEPSIREELPHVITKVQDQLERTHAPDGFNVGINEGEMAGQTIDHFHVHVIPRYEGDVDDPEGGVRGVIPDKQSYRDGC